MAFDVTGKLVVKYDVIQRSETFKTREFVIETSEDGNGRVFTSYIKFQAVQDRTALIDRFQIGETIKVHFNIRGTKWEKNGQVNYITNLDAWRIESVGLQPQATNEPMPAFQADVSTPSDAVDDLPF